MNVRQRRRTRRTSSDGNEEFPSVQILRVFEVTAAQQLPGESLAVRFGPAGFGAGSGHLLITLFQLVNRSLNPVALVDQPLLLAAKRGDRLVLRLRGLAQGGVVRGDFLLPKLPQPIDLATVD